MAKRICHNCGCEFDTPYNAYFCNKPECQEARKEYRRLDVKRRGAEWRRKMKEGKPKSKGGFCKCGKPLEGNLRRCPACVIRDEELAGLCDGDWVYI